MVSSQGDHIETQTAASQGFAVSAKPKADWTAHVDTEQVFRLIDSILPFEACLYHQLLPLSLEGSRLKLGMVNLEDTAALDYVRRILAYMNCSLAPQTLATDVHHAVLSAYLNYTGSQRQPSPPKATAVRAIAAHTGQRLTAQDAAKKSAAERARAESAEAEQSHLDQNSHPTLLVDSPEDLNFYNLDDASPQVSPASVPPSSETFDTNVDALSPGASDQSTQVLGYNHLREAPILKAESLPSSQPSEVSIPVDSLPILPVEPKHLTEPVATLATLSPSELLTELLGRLLVGGIGRLYFERQAQYGRILWSQNGVLQSVLEELPLDVIQGVINELKLLTHLPLVPIQKPKQVEIERLYQKQRLLLRLRVMPGANGEEATVQVLRGAALKFYQQQQLAGLSRDALAIAQNLQQKVNEIRVRARFYPLQSPEQLSLLPALDQVIKNLEQQLEVLKSLRQAHSPDQGSE